MRADSGLSEPELLAPRLQYEFETCKVRSSYSKFVLVLTIGLIAR